MFGVRANTSKMRRDYFVESIEFMPCMILHKTILILEDDLLTLSKILERLATIEQDQPYDFSVVTHLPMREDNIVHPK